MCLAKAYLEEDGARELLLEQIALVKTDRGVLSLFTLFGERTEIEAVIKAVDFENASMIVEKPR